MIPQHKQIFFTAADHLNCYIGLRKPNDEADQWITKEGYVPKGMDVKAKSAKAGKYAGLVVNPYLRKDAFTDEKDWARAKKSWDEFTKNGLPKGYSYHTNGDDMGVLKKEGKGIHADYDLMFVNLADDRGKIRYTSTREAHYLCNSVMRLINRLESRKQMIQHPSEFLYSGVGAAEQEQIYIFGPKRQFMISTSYFKTNEHVL